MVIKLFSSLGTSTNIKDMNQITKCLSDWQNKHIHRNSLTHEIGKDCCSNGLSQVIIYKCRPSVKRHGNKLVSIVKENAKKLNKFFDTLGQDGWAVSFNKKKLPIFSSWTSEKTLIHLPYRTRKGYQIFFWVGVRRWRGRNLPYLTQYDFHTGINKQIKSLSITT